MTRTARTIAATTPGWVPLLFVLLLGIESELIGAPEEGTGVGEDVCMMVGNAVGALVGEKVGPVVLRAVGFIVVVRVGERVGLAVGDSV